MSMLPLPLGPLDSSIPDKSRRETVLEDIVRIQNPDAPNVPDDAIAARDAAERAASMTSIAEAQTLYDAATRQQDPVLVSELLATARSRGWQIGIDAQLAAAEEARNFPLVVQLTEQRSALHRAAKAHQPRRK